MAQVHWTESALNDVLGIVSFIEKDSPNYAVDVGLRILEAADRLSDNPQFGWRVEEFDRDHIRELLVHQYRLI